LILYMSLFIGQIKMLACLLALYLDHFKNSCLIDRLKTDEQKKFRDFHVVWLFALFSFHTLCKRYDFGYDELHVLVNLP